MATVADFRCERPTWCVGCGDFGVLTAMQKAAADLGLKPETIFLVSGIGCSGKISSFFRSFGFHGVHGRALPVATGIKLVNPELTVLVAGGDGDGYAIGLSHFIHACRRNVNITYIVMDNNVYGLTTGQTSPTSPRGFRSKTSPMGAEEEPINPLALAVVSGAGFVAQGFSGDIVGLTNLVREGMLHEGFALINVLSPCVTFNRRYGYDFYKENTVQAAAGAAFDPGSRQSALARIFETDGLCLGVIYRAGEPAAPHFTGAPAPPGPTPAGDGGTIPTAPPLFPPTGGLDRSTWESLLEAFR